MGAYLHEIVAHHIAEDFINTFGQGRLFHVDKVLLGDGCGVFLVMEGVGVVDELAQSVFIEIKRVSDKVEYGLNGFVFLFWLYQYCHESLPLGCKLALVFWLLS